MKKVFMFPVFFPLPKKFFPLPKSILSASAQRGTKRQANSKHQVGRKQEKNDNDNDNPHLPTTNQTTNNQQPITHNQQPTTHN